MRELRRYVGALTFAAVIPWHVASAQSQPGPKPATISFGHVILQIGMAQDRVLAAFAETYALERAPDLGGGYLSYFVNAKSGSTYVGTVSFKDGILDSVTKSWTTQGASDVDYANSLHGVIANFINEGREECRLSTGSKYNPESTSKNVLITCSGKSIWISVLSQAGHTYATVTEMLPAGAVALRER